MKTMILLALIFSASAAVAMPKIGDFATYQVTVSLNGQTASNKLTEMVVSVDPVAKTYNYSTSTISAGQAQPQVSINSGGLDNFMKEEQQVTIALGDCSKVHGTAETVTLVSGKQVSTCSVPLVDGTTTGTLNVAAVPFFNTKIHLQDSNSGMVMDIVMIDYGFGKGM